MCIFADLQIQSIEMCQLLAHIGIDELYPHPLTHTLVRYLCATGRVVGSIGPRYHSLARLCPNPPAAEEQLLFHWGLRDNMFRKMVNTLNGKIVNTC